MQRHIAAMHCCMPRQKRRRISFYATYDIAHSVFSMLLYSSYDCYTLYSMAEPENYAGGGGRLFCL